MVCCSDSGNGPEGEMKNGEYETKLDQSLDRSENDSRSENDIVLNNNSNKSYVTMRTKECQDSDNVIVNTLVSSKLEDMNGKNNQLNHGVSMVSTEMVVLKDTDDSGELLKKHKVNFIVKYFKKKCQGWTREQVLTIVILSFVEFFASAVISLQAPFYPDVARKKGAGSTEVGFVFGVFELTVFIMSPIYGAKMSQWGPRRVFNLGILATGICCIIFGLLDDIEGRVPFIASSLFVRVIEAMGDAAFETASFTIIAIKFPDSVASSFAILEISYGFGLIVGPTLGGALYEAGGYKLPFFAMGAFLFASAIATYFYLPEPKSKQTVATVDLSQSTSSLSSSPVGLGGFEMFQMLRIPVIAMTAYSIVAGTAGVGFLSASLEHHLEQYQLSKLEVGAVFILNGGAYAITAPAWGWICDHTDRQKLITLIGTMFTILGFLFIGPVAFIPLEMSLTTSCIGLSLFGFGIAATLVSAFLQALNDAIAHGYPDDTSTYGLVSGLWTSMAALGYFIGPSIGGVLDDVVGFRWSSVFIIAGQVVLIIMLGGYYTATRRCLKHSEKEVRLEENIKTRNMEISIVQSGLILENTNKFQMHDVPLNQ